MLNKLEGDVKVIDKERVDNRKISTPNDIVELKKANLKLKEELLENLNQMEDILIKLNNTVEEKERVEKAYLNLKNSKLGSLMVKYWKFKRHLRGNS